MRLFEAHSNTVEHNISIETICKSPTGIAFVLMLVSHYAFQKVQAACKSPAVIAFVIVLVLHYAFQREWEIPRDVSSERPQKENSKKDTAAVQMKRDGAILFSFHIACKQSLLFLTAKELTIVASVSGSMNAAAASPWLWRSLWQRRYSSVLWSVPKALQQVHAENPIAVLVSCLKELRLAPRWWVKGPQETYAEEVQRHHKR